MALAIGLLLLILLLFGGASVWLAFASAGVFLNQFMEKLPNLFMSQVMFAGMNYWVLLSVPYFLIMGNLMAAGGCSKALFNFVDDLVGHLPGGMPTAAIVSCMIFGALTGSSIATVIGIGTIAIPPMLKLGFDRKFCMGVIACSGTLGQMIPPSIYAIIYGSLTQNDIGVLFIAQIVPGVVITIGLSAMATVISIKNKYITKSAVSWGQRGKSFVKAFPALLLPVVVMGGIYGGIFTPTEAATIGCIYALIVSLFIYRALTLESLKNSLFSALSTTAVIYFILAAADMLARPLTAAEIPQSITTLLVNSGLSFGVLLLAVCLLWFAFGCVMDPVPIMFLTIPILYPALVAIGINPIHFCVVTVAWMMVAQVNPPFGVSLFALSSRFNEPIENIFKGAWPFLMVLTAAAFLITYVPILSMILPNMMNITK